MLIDETAPPDDPKRQRILDTAPGVFLTYGYQRTTMDDVARAAGMSRPALYQYFRNKTDIYRAIADGFFQIAFEAARDALAGDGPLAERLETMLDDSVFAMLARFQATPHGAEILDAKTELAGDLVEQWNRRLIELVEQAILREVAGGRADLASRGFTARGLSELFWDAIEGAKRRVSDIDSQRAATRMIVRLIADAAAMR